MVYILALKLESEIRDDSYQCTVDDKDGDIRDGFSTVLEGNVMIIQSFSCGDFRVIFRKFSNIFMI